MKRYGNFQTYLRRIPILALGSVFAACSPQLAGTASSPVSNGATATATTNQSNGASTPGSPSNIYLAGALAVATTDCTAYALTIKDSSQNTVALTSSLTVSLTTSGSGSYYSDAGCSASLPTIVLSSGTNSKVIYYKNLTAQNIVLLATSATLYPGNALSVAVSVSTDKVSFSGISTYLAQNTCSSPITVGSLNGAGNPLSVGSATSVALSGSVTTRFYAGAGCAGAPVAAVTIAQNQSSAVISVKNTAAESIALTGAVAGWTSGSLPLTIYGPLSISPTSKNVGASSSSQIFTGSGGVAPYTYSIVNGSLNTCSVGPSTGVFTAPAPLGTCSVRATDQAGQTASAAITVVSTLAISPTVIALQAGHNKTFTATGGSGTYTYAITSGAQAGENLTNSSNTGIYTSPSAAGTSTLQVSDGTGATATVTITTLPQPLVELLFDENQYNWTVNGGTSNVTHTKAGFNGRSNLTFSTNVPAGTSSTSSVDFGNGGQDVAVDLLQPGGLRGDYYYNSTNWLPPIAGSRLDSSINYSANSNNTVSPFPAVWPSSGIGSIRHFGRIIVPTSESYTWTAEAYTSRGGGFCGEVSSQVSRNGVTFLVPGLQSTCNSDSTSPGITETFGPMLDFKLDSSAGFYDWSYTLKLQWQTGIGGAYPGLVAVPSSAMYAPLAPSPLSSLPSFTLTGWLNNRSAAQDGTILATWLNSAGGGAELRYKNDGSLQLGINESAGTQGSAIARSTSGRVTTDPSTLSSNWVFYAVTYNSGSGQVQFYFGEPGTSASLDSTQSYSQGAISSTIAELTLGNFNTSSLSSREGNANVYRGMIDEFRIYPGVLTLQQVRAVQTY